MIEEVTRIPSAAQQKLTSFYTSYCQRYAQDPMLFCTEALSFTPTWQQAELLEIINDFNRVSVRSGHGCGKTRVTASIILWYLTTRPFSRILCVAPNINQLTKVLQPEVSAGFYALCKKFPPMPQLFGITRTTLFSIQHPNRWMCISRSSRKESAQGLAGQHGEHFMCVVEEASAVPEEIFEVLDGALSLPKNKMLMIGNPAATFGRFYDSFHSKKDTFQNLWWNGTESPLVSPELIKIFEEEYGRGSREWSVRIEGAFPKKVSGMLLGESEIASMENAEVEHQSPPMRVISVDVAGSGRDSSIILIADVSGDGNDRVVEVREISEYQIGVDTVELAQMILFRAKEMPSRIIVDAVGVGQGVSDFLTQSEQEHISLNWGAASWFSDRFHNQRAEAYHWLRECLVRQSMFCRRHSKLFNQLSNLPFGYSERGKLQMMQKDRMIQRGIKSPDIADALAMVFLVPYEAPINIGTSQAKPVLTPTQQTSVDVFSEDSANLESVAFGPAVPTTPNPLHLPTTKGEGTGDPFVDFLQTDW